MFIKYCYTCSSVEIFECADDSVQARQLICSYPTTGFIKVWLLNKVIFVATGITLCRNESVRGTGIIYSLSHPSALISAAPYFWSPRPYHRLSPLAASFKPQGKNNILQSETPRSGMMTLWHACPQWRVQWIYVASELKLMHRYIFISK